MTTTACAEGDRICAAPEFPYLTPDLIELKVQPNGTYVMSAPAAFGLAISCTYWTIDNVQDGDDRWRYKLTNHSQRTHAGPFAHVTERGCQIAIWQHFIDIGLIEFPEDNSHLDARDADIHRKTELAWCDQSASRPRVGDFLQNADGSFVRFCNITKTYAQTTTALKESYYVGPTGCASYSGGLDPGVDLELLALSLKMKRGQFWFFHHGRAGGGRGVKITLPCRIWQHAETS